VPRKIAVALLLLIGVSACARDAQDRQAVIAEIAQGCQDDGRGEPGSPEFDQCMRERAPWYRVTDPR
jgi:hypothetical protein